jgi:hypothetical protein
LERGSGKAGRIAVCPLSSFSTADGETKCGNFYERMSVDHQPNNYSTGNNQHFQFYSKVKPMKNKSEIFISYAWKDAHEKAEDSREKIVDEICRIFVGHGYEILRDKNHLTYRQSIRDFMQRLGKGNYIIAVISDK